MSKFNDINSYSLGSHNWFFPLDAAITSPAAGNVAKENWPDADEPTLDDRYVGDTEEWSIKKTVESEEVFKPNPGLLTRKDIVTFFQGLDFEITTNSLRRVAMQILLGSATELTEDVGEFPPLGAPPPVGLWISQKYTQDNEKIFEANFWCRVDVQEAGSGNKKLIKPKFMVKLLDSPSNIFFFGKPELLEV